LHPHTTAKKINADNYQRIADKYDIFDTNYVLCRDEKKGNCKINDFAIASDTID